jgi:hypothetical protein
MQQERGHRAAVIIRTNRRKRSHKKGRERKGLITARENNIDCEHHFSK